MTNSKKMILVFVAFFAAVAIITGSIIAIYYLFINKNTGGINLKQEEYHWLETEMTSVKLIASGNPVSTKANKDYPVFYNYTADEYYITLDDYYDIDEVRITFKNDTKYSYSVQVAQDERIWFNTDISDGIMSGNIYTAKVNETYRKYIKIQLMENTKVEVIEKVEIHAAKTIDPPALKIANITDNVARPVIMPIPDSVANVVNSIIDLSGDNWKIQMNPRGSYWKTAADEKWAKAKVPSVASVTSGEYIDVVKGINSEMAYKTVFKVPSDAKGNRIYLRFESVVDLARVWIGNYLVGTHNGGYGTFDLDVTDYIVYGAENNLTVGVAKNEIAPTFGWAGITGSVKLLIVGSQHFTRFVVETDLDETYTNGTLTIHSSVSLGNAPGAAAEIELIDPNGDPVKLNGKFINYSTTNDISTAINVSNVKKWDAEHPDLYTLKTKMIVDNKTVEEYSCKIGFREVVLDELNMLVNGKDVVLRGVNWTNIDPVSGYAFNYEGDKESLLKLKQANINMIRTSHFPQYEAILALCDEIGIYVEFEMGPHIVCQWASTYFERYDTLDNPKYKDWFMTLYSEGIERARSHSSVIYYSVSNESDWGSNIASGIDYIRNLDNTRPIKSSWGYMAPAGYTDIGSVHYGDIWRDIEKPTIWDEYAHLYTGNQKRLELDPALRMAYGKEIQKSFEKIWETDGLIGGAIWQARDWTVLTPNGPWNSFQTTWGLLDIWNREKPEYYDVKKAYSPVHMDEKQNINNPGSGLKLTLDIENRYDFTFLNELSVRWTVGKETGEMNLPTITPHKWGKFSLPRRDWKVGEVLKLEFIRNNNEIVENYIVDTYIYTIGGKTTAIYEKPSGKAPLVTENDTSIILQGTDFSITFDKSTGKINNGTFKGEQVITSGPDINLGIDMNVSGWKLNNMSYVIEGSEVVVTLKGNYSIIGETSFVIRIDGTGRIDVEYDFTLPTSNEISEVGIVYELTKDIQSLSWDRNSDLWSYYPQNSIARLTGTAMKLRSEDKKEIYGIKPLWDWKEDTVQYRLGLTNDSKCTADFRASKIGVYTASMNLASGIGLKSEMNGTGSVRGSLNTSKQILFQINNEYGSLGIGEFQKYDYPIISKGGNKISYHIITRFTEKPVENQGGLS